MRWMYIWQWGWSRTGDARDIGWQIREISATIRHVASRHLAPPRPAPPPPLYFIAMFGNATYYSGSDNVPYVLGRWQIPHVLIYLQSADLLYMDKFHTLKSLTHIIQYLLLTYLNPKGLGKFYSMYEYVCALIIPIIKSQ